MTSLSYMNRCSFLLGIILLSFSTFSLAVDQRLTAVPSSIDVQPKAKDIEIVFVYETSPSNLRTTGVGVSVYFDSSKLKFNSMRALHDGGLVAISNTPDLIQLDSNDADDNSLTDSRAVIAYLGVEGAWPSAAATMPLNLFSINFDAVSTTSVAKTDINLILDTASGFVAFAPPVMSDSCLNCFSLDSDNDGEVSPVTDGLLISRFLKGYSGPALISNALGPNSTRPDAGSIIRYLSENRSQLDVDGDGKQDFSTDGNLIVRYLFGLRGRGLTRDILNQNSIRTDPSKIANYI